MNKVDSVSDTLFIEATAKATSRNDILRILGIAVKGNNVKKVQQRLDALNISNDVFKRNQLNKVKQLKTCPVCNKQFYVSKLGKAANKICCSRGCANTYFRSGENNPTFLKNPRYATICFLNHKKECVVCGEQNIVAVHHFDENHKNNDPANLIPLCPTHHQYIHSRFKDLIYNKVVDYRNSYLNRA